MTKRGPGRPRRANPWSKFSLEIPEPLHDEIAKAALHRDESVAQWVRDACQMRLRAMRVKPPEDEGTPGAPPLIVG